MQHPNQENGAVTGSTEPTEEVTPNQSKFLDDETENTSDISEQEDEVEERVYNIFIPEASTANIIINGDIGKIDGTHRKHKTLEPLRILNIHPRHLTKLWDSNLVRSNAEFKGTPAFQNQYANDVDLAEQVHGDKILDKTLYREDAEWTRSVVSDAGRNIGITSPNISSRKGLGPGEKTAARINQSFGLGRTINIPLWQTGIWMTLKAPMLSEELELDRRIAHDRVLLGRMSHGRVFSNDSVIINRELVDFIFSHTLDTSLPTTNFEEMLKYIKLPDLHAMALGMACTIHVNGFPFRQPCVTNLETCTHIEKATLNLPKLLWVDNKKITPKQRRIMSKYGSKVSVEELKAYQEEIHPKEFGTIKLNDDVSIEFKIPTLAEHFDSGEAWVNDLSAAAEIAYGTNISIDQRNEYMFGQSITSKLRSHTHWISKIIEIVDTPNGEVIEEHLPGAGMENILMQLSADAEVVEKIIEGIENYYAAVLMSVIGIPNYDCPACGAFHTDARGKIHAIHALDPVSIFFQMQQFRVINALTQGD